MINFLKSYFFRGTSLFYFHICLVVTYLCTMSIVFFERLPSRGEIGIPATLIGHISRTALSDPLLFEFSRGAFALFGLLWCLQLLTPLTSWLTSLSYLVFASMIFENSPGAERHSIHMVPMVFLTFSLYYSFYWREIKESLKGKLNKQVLGPSWGFDLLVVAIGMSHSWAGISKIVESGLQWPNGHSLQIWVYLWGLDNFLNKLVLGYNGFALFGQWAVLIVETSAIGALFFKKNRFWWACVLVSFHLVNQWMWGWNFLYWCPIILFCYGNDFVNIRLRKDLSLKN